MRGSRLYCRRAFSLRACVATVFLTLLAGFAVFRPAVTAQEGDQMVAPGWVHEHWTAADGLPVNAVNAAVQGKGGYIWLVTFDGLVRFDGVRFTVFNSATHPNLPSNRFTELVQTEDGALWLLSEQHHLIRFQENAFTVFDTEDGLPHNDVFVLRPKPDGSLLIGTRGGVARYRRGTIERLAAEEVAGAVSRFLGHPDSALWVGTDDGVVRIENEGHVEHVIPGDALPSAEVRSLARVGNAIWVGTTAGVSVWEDGTARSLPSLDVLSQQMVLDIVPAGETVWLGTHDGVYGYRDGRIVHRPGPDEHVALHFRPAWTDEAGALWVNTRRRLLKDGKTVFRSTELLFPTVTDREGNVWIPAGDGLHRLRASPFVTWGAENGLHSKNVYAIYESGNGALWLGTLGGGVTRIRGDHVATLGWKHGGPGSVWALEEDGDGTLWIGGTGLCRLPATVALQANFHPGACRRDGLPPELANGTVRAIHHREDGSVWFGTHNGLFRLDRGEWTRLGSNEGVPHQPIRVFLEGPDLPDAATSPAHTQRAGGQAGGALWMGTNGGGIVRFKNGHFTTFTTSNGLCSDLVRALHFDDGGTLWVGTEDRGLCRVEIPDGNLSEATVIQIDRQDGLYDHVVHRILDDGMGRLWMSGNRGIWWVNKEDLDDFAAGERARIHSTAYTERSGLPTREANGGVHPAGIRASDGRLWFPTQTGAVVVDPTELPRNRYQPPVHIEEVVVGSGNDRRTLTESEMPDQLALGSDERRLEIAYTAPSFIDPGNVRFRYRLEGVDKDWVDAGTRRLATYANLRPGRYRFRVIAANPDGVWNETGAAFDMRVRPMWYETRTFLGLCGLLLVAVGLAVGLWRRRESERRRRELEVQVEERTEELSEALTTVADQAAALEEIDKAKSRFFANISHEFRTPLTVILGGLKDTLSGRFGALSDKFAGQQRAMLRNTRRMQQLIDEVLDLNRLESGHLELDPSPGDLVQFLHRLVEIHAPLAERNGIDLILDCDVESCPRFFDAEKLKKIVGNLLSNALKFTPRGGSVRVSLYGGEETEISVADDGPGIPAEEQEKIFKRFEQLEGTGHTGGSGIGLALARELAELHGGTTTLESVPGEGSTFTVRLPLEEAVLPGTSTRKLSEVEAEADSPPTAALEPSEHEPKGEKNHPDASRRSDVEPDRTTVLVIEDNDDVRAYVRRSLEEAYRVLEAVEGNNGLQKAREALPDVIVSDIMLPGIDGYEVARRLKADSNTACIPVVMLTARAAEEDQTEGYGAGAEVYLTKPFSPETLRAAISRLLEERLRLRQQLRVQGRKDDEKETTNGHATLRDRVRAAVLERLYDEDFGVDELAIALNMSRPTLYRRFNEEAGLSPGAFIRTVRLEHAGKLLSNGAGSVSEVAYAIGFKSLSHFTHSFRDHHGELPSSILGAQGK